MQLKTLRNNSEYSADVQLMYNFSAWAVTAVAVVAAIFIWDAKD